MPRYAKKGAPDFSEKVKTGQGSKFDRSDDLIMHLRADGTSWKNLGTSSYSINSYGSTAMSVQNPRHNFPVFAHKFNGVDTFFGVTGSAGVGIEVFPAAGNNVMIAGWINLDSLPTADSGNGGCAVIEQQSDGNTYSFSVFINSNGQLGIRLFNADNSSNFAFRSFKTNMRLATDTWYHFGFILVSMDSDPDGDDTMRMDSNDNPKWQIFINGQQVATTGEHGPSGSPHNGDSVNFTNSVMHEFATASIFIGKGLGGYDNSGPSIDQDTRFGGHLAEVAIWRSQTGFYAEDMLRVYGAVENLSSGFINLPERIMLQNLDSRGSRPPIARPFDVRSKGNNKVFFDDSKATTLTSVLSAESLTKSGVGGHDGYVKRIVSAGGETQHFWDAVTSSVGFPTMLHQRDALYNTVYADYESGNLFITSSVQLEPSTNIYQEHYVRQDNLQNNGEIVPSSSYYPFEESRIYFDPTAPFHITGTLDSVLQGFDQPTFRKTAITIHSHINATQTLGHESKVTVGNEGNYLFYHNFSNRSMVAKGGFFGQAGSFMTVPHQEKKFFLSGGLGFGPFGGEFMPMMNLPGNSINGGQQNGYYYSSDRLEFMSGSASELHHLGRPIDSFGFPSTDLYEAHDGQSVDMSNYIDGPFLVEKIAVEFEYEHLLQKKVAFHQNQAPSGWTSARPTKLLPQGMGTSDTLHFYFSGFTVFLLNQFGNINETSNTKAIWGKVGAGNLEPTYYPREITGSKREMIGYGQAVFMEAQIGAGIDANDAWPIMSDGYPLNEYRFLSGGLAREQTIVHPRVTSGGGSQRSTGTMRLEFTPKLIFPSAFRGQIQVNGNPSGDSRQQTTSVGWESVGTRRHTDVEAQSHRAYASTMTGQVPDLQTPEMTEMVTSQASFKDTADFPMPAINTGSLDNSSPYLIFPKDKLIVGIQADIPTTHGTSTAIGNYSSDRGAVKVKAGKFNLTLYGSYIRDNKPVEPSLNQLLSNDVVYESIGSEPIFDQFDLENIASMSGSMYDEVVTGSIKGPLYQGSVGKLDWAAPVKRYARERSMYMGDYHTELAAGMTELTEGIGGDATGSVHHAVYRDVDYHWTSKIHRRRLWKSGYYMAYNHLHSAYIYGEAAALAGSGSNGYTILPGDYNGSYTFASDSPLYEHYSSGSNHHGYLGLKSVQQAGESGKPLHGQKWFSTEYVEDANKWSGGENSFYQGAIGHWFGTDTEITFNIISMPDTINANGDPSTNGTNTMGACRIPVSSGSTTPSSGIGDFIGVYAVVHGDSTCRNHIGVQKVGGFWDGKWFLIGQVPMSSLKNGTNSGGTEVFTLHSLTASVKVNPDPGESSFNFCGHTNLFSCTGEGTDSIAVAAGKTHWKAGGGGDGSPSITIGQYQLPPQSTFYIFVTESCTGTGGYQNGTTNRVLYTNVEVTYSGSSPTEHTGYLARAKSSRVSEGGKGVDVSAFRNVRMAGDVRYYDSIMPNLKSYVSKMSGFNVADGEGTTALHPGEGIEGLSEAYAASLKDATFRYSKLMPNAAIGIFSTEEQITPSYWPEGRESINYFYAYPTGTMPGYTFLEKTIKHPWVYTGNPSRVIDEPMLFLNVSAQQHSLTAQIMCSNQSARDHLFSVSWHFMNNDPRLNDHVFKDLSRDMYPYYGVWNDDSGNQLGPHKDQNLVLPRNPVEYGQHVAEFKDSILTGSNIAGARGFKYGVHNTKPNYRSCIFRRDRYGQFRDMIEMGGNAALWVGDTTVFAVESAFRTRDGNVADPEATSCSNMSTYSSSSAPFFDRDTESDDLTDTLVIRNRGTFVSEFFEMDVDDLEP